MRSEADNPYTHKHITSSIAYGIQPIDFQPLEYPTMRKKGK